MIVSTASMILKAMVFIDLLIALHDHSASAHEFESHGVVAWHAGRRLPWYFSCRAAALSALQLGMSQQACQVAHGAVQEGSADLLRRSTCWGCLRT